MSSLLILLNHFSIILNERFWCGCCHFNFSFCSTGLAPLSDAERARRFRENNKNWIREEDALRKRHMRLSMKIKDPAKNEERLRKQREYKRNYRQNVKATAALSESQ